MTEAQIKEIQTRLQEKGLYQGTIDGELGPATANAIAREQQMEANTSEADLKKQELELERQRLLNEEAERKRNKQIADAEAAKAAEREEAADPWSETFLPFAAGAGGGAVYGELANRGLNKFEAGNVAALREISDELGPTDRLTSSQLNRSRAAGAAAAAERFAPTNPLMKAASGVGRAASYGIPAGVVYNEYSNYQERANDPNLTETERTANQQIANALLGVTTGIGVEGGRRFFFPNREPGMGQAQMRIQTARDFARRTDANDARALERPAQPDPAPPEPKTTRPKIPGSQSDLMELARRYNVKNRSKMSTEDLRTAVSEAIKGTSSPRGGAAVKLLKSPAFAPIVAGGVAADAAYNQARAEGSSPAASAAPAAAQGAAAGGAVAAGGYGVNRLLQAMPAAARTAMGSGAAMAMPGEIIPAMTDYAPEDVNMGRNWLARNLPEGMQFGAIDEAREMAQVPERNPMSRPIDPSMPNASALEVPQNLPEAPAGYHQMPDGSIMADSEMQGGGGEQTPDFDQYIADLQAIFAEMEQGQQPQRRPAQTPRPAPPPAYGGQQNRLLQPTGY